MKKFICIMLTIFFVSAATPTFAQFKDVSDTSPLALEINYLVNEKVIFGYPDNTFRPNDVLQKKHVAAMLVRALKLPTTNVKNPNYQDVPITHPFYKEIAAAQNAGIFGTAPYFAPEAQITRGVMAQLLVKAYALKELPPAEGEAIAFTDLGVNHPYYPAVRLAVLNNIINGNTDGSFKPNQLLTRAHFSAFLARAQSRVFDKFTPAQANNYYYQVSDAQIKLQYKGLDTYKNEIWTQTLLNRNESLPNMIYGQNARSFYYAIDQGASYVLDIPITIGQSYSSYPDGKTKVTNTVLSTKGTITIQGKTYNDVVILRTVAPNTASVQYFAKNLGLIAITTLDGQFEWALTNIEAR